MVVFDEELWPLLKIRYSDLDGDGIRQIFDHIVTCSRRREKYVIVFNGDSSLSSKVRKDASELLKEHRALMNQRCLANALVFRSSFTRGILTAIMWLAGAPPFPVKIFEDESSAVLWAQGILRGASARDSTTEAHE